MTDQEVIATLKAGQLCLYKEDDPEQVYQYADELEREFGLQIDRMYLEGEGILLWIQSVVSEQLLDSIRIRSAVS